ncbi:MAG: SRPBCC family protein [Synechococcales cyanobacterium T60_A2020_003]|nr:SRPBCC family protein [Synechococcales cyanobacterium T60_A2020_003]
MFDFLAKCFPWKISARRSFVRTYQAISTASVDALWQKVENLADVSWHPVIISTNAPNGLLPTPGLIYQAVTCFFPIPIRIFVERVNPRELLSIRILALPGLEERVTYQVESTVCGTQISYSVTLRGWLSPLVWSVIRPYAARVASQLAQAAEQDLLKPRLNKRSEKLQQNFRDLFGLFVACLGLSYGVAHYY